MTGPARLSETLTILASVSHGSLFTGSVSGAVKGLDHRGAGSRCSTTPAPSQNPYGLQPWRLVSSIVFPTLQRRLGNNWSAGFATGQLSTPAVAGPCRLSAAARKRTDCWESGKDDRKAGAEAMTTAGEVFTGPKRGSSCHRWHRGDRISDSCAAAGGETGYRTVVLDYRAGDHRGRPVG